MPLSLLLLGTFLSFSFELKHWQRMAQILAVRYTVGISIGLLLYFFLPFEPMFKTTLLLGLCLPISLAVVPFSVEFGYDNKFVGTVNNATIMISFALMWIGVTLVHV
jgi:predicted permease